MSFGYLSLTMENNRKKLADFENIHIRNRSLLDKNNFGCQEETKCFNKTSKIDLQDTVLLTMKS